MIDGHTAALVAEARYAPAPPPAATDRRERTRQRILTGAFRLIGHERGLGVRIEEICAQAGISRGSFYNYFSGMEPLFAALSYNITHGFVGRVQAEMAGMDRSAERCDAAMRYYLERARSDAAWGWAMVNIGAMGPLFGAETYAATEQNVRNGIARGEFLIPCAAAGRDLVLGAIHAAMQTHLRHGSVPGMPQIVSRSVLRGLGVPHSTAERLVSRQLPPL